MGNLQVRVLGKESWIWRKRWWWVWWDCRRENACTFAKWFECPVLKLTN